MINFLKNNYRISNHRRGYIALISVIIVGAIGTAIMLSVMLSGINSAKTDLALQQAGSAKTSSASCGEEALQKILETGTTTGSGGLTIGSSTCTYTITSLNGQNITIEATGISGVATSKVKIVIATTSPAILLSSWQEVADF